MRLGGDESIHRFGPVTKSSSYLGPILATSKLPAANLLRSATIRRFGEFPILFNGPGEIVLDQARREKDFRHLRCVAGGGSGNTKAH